MFEVGMAMLVLGGLVIVGCIVVDVCANARDHIMGAYDIKKTDRYYSETLEF